MTIIIYIKSPSRGNMEWKWPYQFMYVTTVGIIRNYNSEFPMNWSSTNYGFT